MVKRAPSIIFVLIYILLAVTPTLQAEDQAPTDELTQEIFNNISEECAHCAAYYWIVVEALKRSGGIEAAKMYEQSREAMLKYAIETAKIGRNQEMASKVTLARLELDMKSMTEEIEYDFSNISVLLNKYGEDCKEIIENPEKIVDEWTLKIMERHGLK